MARATAGIHHVTAIAGDPRRNVRFYAGTLGLALVKKTVNYDDPTTYHLYYGDDPGLPGTILTFFPWPGARPGRRGVGQATAVAFRVPEGSLAWWADRLSGEGIALEGPLERHGTELLAFDDPDGLRLELLADPEAGATEEAVPEDSPVPADRAIRGFEGVTLSAAGFEGTAGVLDEILGYRLLRDRDGRHEFRAGAADPATPGARVDILVEPAAAPGRVAVGSVHHVAFRAAGDEEQAGWREAIARRGLDVTPVIDRRYFRSIYFREPGGVLFEIATDAPGFTVDEPAAALGGGLTLPPWLEGRREEIEAALPPLDG